MTNRKEETLPLLSWPNKERFFIFLTWGTAALVAFPVVYGLTNHFAGLSANRYTLYWEWERNVPFIPEFVWFYLSLNVALFLPLFMCDGARLRKYCQTNLLTLAIAAALFVLFPADLGFERVIPAEGLYRTLFQNIHALDQPHNLVPSLHITFSALAFFAVIETHRRKRWLHLLLIVWMIGIAASVVFTRQHHILDILGGILLSFVGIRFFYLREVVQNPQLAHQK